MKYVGILDTEGHVYDYMPIQDPLDAWHWHISDNKIEVVIEEE